MSQLGTRPNLAFVFASFDHQPRFGGWPRSSVSNWAPTACWVAPASRSSAMREEVEGSSALAVWAAHLPGVTLLPMHLEFRTRSRRRRVRAAGTIACSTPGPRTRSLLLLADPFSFPADVLLGAVERRSARHCSASAAWPVAAGGRGENRLLLGGRVIEARRRRRLMHGPIKLRTVVSQGCRPIGRPFVVTKAEQNMIFELGGRRALEQLQELFSRTSAGGTGIGAAGPARGASDQRISGAVRPRRFSGPQRARCRSATPARSRSATMSASVRPCSFTCAMPHTADEDLKLLVKAAKDAGSNESRAPWSSPAMAAAPACSATASRCPGVGQPLARIARRRLLRARRNRPRRRQEFLARLHRQHRAVRSVISPLLVVPVPVVVAALK